MNLFAPDFDIRPSFSVTLFEVSTKVSCEEWTVSPRTGLILFSIIYWLSSIHSRFKNQKRQP